MPCSQIKTLIWCCIMKKQQFEGLILLIIQYKHAVEYKTTKWWPQKSWINISLITLLKAAVYVVAASFRPNQPPWQRERTIVCPSFWFLQRGFLHLRKVCKMFSPRARVLYWQLDVWGTKKHNRNTEQFGETLNDVIVSFDDDIYDIYVYVSCQTVLMIKLPFIEGTCICTISVLI